MLRNNPGCYILNAVTIGDTIAALPAIRYAIKHYHQDGKYKILCFKHVKDIVESIAHPDNIFDLNIYMEFEEQYWVRWLYPENFKDTANGNSPIPNHVSLTKFAYWQLLKRLPDDKNEYKYPIYNPKISFQGFQDVFSEIADGKPYIVLCPCFSSLSRRMPERLINEIIEYFTNQNIKVVLLGSEAQNIEGTHVSYSSVDNIKHDSCIDYRNKTSLDESAMIMDSAEAVIGFDGGLIHLAAMLEYSKIICCYTVIPPELRQPREENFIALMPQSTCCACTGKYQKEDWDYQFCVTNTYECCNSFSLSQIIDAFETLTHPKISPS